MEKKTLKMTGKTVTIQVILIFAVLLSFTILILLTPSKSQIVQRLYASVFLVAAAIYDIRTNEVPLVVCIGLMSLALIYAVIFSWDFAAVGTAGLIMVLLMAVRLVNRKTIGMGDVLLLGFSIIMLSINEILRFVFLTFLFSSISGIVLSIKRRRFKDAAVPLAPCIAAAFITQCLLKY
ncbi:MAG: A24 family peptidase [Bacillota bacterium]|jgi:Flp pilus assembly protein protease CpaA|nr:A24 family peptidase [Bacillota bacterium]